MNTSRYEHRARANAHEARVEREHDELHAAPLRLTECPDHRYQAAWASTTVGACDGCTAAHDRAEHHRRVPWCPSCEAAAEVAPATRGSAAATSPEPSDPAGHEAGSEVAAPDDDGQDSTEMASDTPREAATATPPADVNARPVAARRRTR